MYACAYINIGILISTYVHMHTNERRNMLFFPIFSNDFSRWWQEKEEESASHFRMPCAADERSARFGTMRAFHIADMKNPWTNFVHGFGADDQTWTGDLILTNCPWCTKMLLNSGEYTKINFNPTHIRSRVHQEKGAVLPKEKRTKKELTRLRLVLRREIA